MVWPAVQPHDVVLDEVMQLLPALFGSRRRQDIHHHRNHGVLPVAAQQRKCAVEIKDGCLIIAAGEIFPHHFNHCRSTRICVDIFVATIISRQRTLVHCFQGRF